MDINAFIPRVMLSCYDKARKPLPDAHDLVLDFPASTAVRKKLLFFINCPVYGTVIASENGLSQGLLKRWQQEEPEGIAVLQELACGKKVVWHRTMPRMS
jgi:hypothetical protein